jgi:hypothetical protein
MKSCPHDRACEREAFRLVDDQVAASFQLADGQDEISSPRSDKMKSRPYDRACEREAFRLVDDQVAASF